MKNPENKLIEIFCHIDDFNQLFIKELRTHQLTDGTRVRIKPCSLNESEVMTIVIYFHLMRYRDFKHYCLFTCVSICGMIFQGLYHITVLLS
jgi:hypothetical protein